MRAFGLKTPVIVAVDTASLDAARHLVTAVADEVGAIKLGLEFFCANGLDGLRAIADLGAPLFLDLKLHDIPNTVAGAMRALVALRPALITLHASGGRAMLEAAADAARESAEALRIERPRLLGVTVLTSLNDDDLHDIGQDPAPNHQVDRLATLAQDARLDGVVCSAWEIEHLRSRFGTSFGLMVPGIRPSWSPPDDQKRVMTPADALRIGADALVIGRPITRATEPAAAARRINAEIAASVAS